MRAARWIGGKVMLYGGMQAVGWIIGGLLMPWTTKGMY